MALLAVHSLRKVEVLDAGTLLATDPAQALIVRAEESSALYLMDLL
jgi:hypothetical protein